MYKVYIYDDLNNHLYVDPTVGKFVDHPMFRSYSTSSDALLEILPRVVHYNGETYRMSYDALNFTLCMIVPKMDKELYNKYY